MIKKTTLITFFKVMAAFIAIIYLLYGYVTLDFKFYNYEIFTTATGRGLSLLALSVIIFFSAFLTDTVFTKEDK